jgi:hypothetical protein
LDRFSEICVWKFGDIIGVDDIDFLIRSALLVECAVQGGSKAGDDDRA